MTPKKEETKRLQEASKETDSINGREKFIRVFSDSCINVPGKRTKQEKKKDEDLRKELIDDILKSFPFKIDTKILNQIKDLKFHRVILIVGENVDLAERVKSCISTIYIELYSRSLHILSLIDGKYTVRKPGFKSQSYVGWDEVNIKDHLFLSQNPNPLIDHFKEGGILFLRGINDKKTLERLIDTEREYRFLHGVLIINTNKADIISQEFLDKTEKVYLKTTMSFDTNTLVVTVNDNEKYIDLQDSECKLFKLLYDKKGEIVSYDDIRKEAFFKNTGDQQIHNAISNLKKKFNKYVDIENKRGVGYAMTV